MKQTGQCPKCGARRVVRVPDRPGRCASGNNIYLSGFENFGKVPVIRYVCCGCGYTENRVESPDSLQRIGAKWG